MCKIHKCYAQNAETLCSKFRITMLKMQKHYAQKAEMLCSKSRNVMLKKQKCYAQNAEMWCWKCRNIMLKMQKRYAEHAETLCWKCRNVQACWTMKQQLPLSDLLLWSLHIINTHTNKVKTSCMDLSWDHFNSSLQANTHIWPQKQWFWLVLGFKKNWTGLHQTGFFLEMLFRGGNSFWWERKCEKHPVGCLNLLVFGGEI